MPPAESEQLDWHKAGKQGCMFAQAMSVKFNPDSNFWVRILMEDEVGYELISKICDKVAIYSKLEENQAVSILIPSIKTQENLIDFLRLIKSHFPGTFFECDNSSIRNHTLISIRFPSSLEPGISFWVIGLGNFDFFPKTRQSPVFEIAFATKSKDFLLKKYNRFSHFQPTENSKIRKGELDSSHLADIQIEGTTENTKKDNKLWNNTQELKKAVLRDLYGDIRSKAKTSFTLPGDIFF
ncbi:MAG: hypothetical protein NTW29_08345 [Bacteroidetes bacterium]|nr:hypothetical protein [Bacteroidota bacterium]